MDDHSGPWTSGSIPRYKWPCLADFVLPTLLVFTTQCVWKTLGATRATPMHVCIEKLNVIISYFFFGKGNVDHENALI